MLPCHLRHLGIVPSGQSPYSLAADLRVLVGDVVLFMRIGGQVEQHLIGKQMKPVVVRADVQPLIEADASLADVDALTEDQLIAAARFAASYGRGERLTVPDRLRLAAEQFDQRGRPVDVVVQRFVEVPGQAAGPFDNHGDMAGAFVGRRMFAVDTQLALILTMIRRDDDRRLVVDTCGLELVTDHFDLIIDVSDRGVVAVDHPAKAAAVGDAAWVSRVLRVRLAVIHHDILRGVRAGQLHVSLEQFVGDPVGQRRVGERVAVCKRRAIGRVRVPEVDVQVPLIAGGVFVEPFVHDGHDLLGRLPAAPGGVVHFVEAGVDMMGRMSLPEWRDHRSVKAEFLKLLGHALAIEPILKAAPGPFDFRLRGSAPVTDDPRLNAEPPAIQSRARRHAGRVGGVVIGKTHTLGPDRVNRRRRGAVIAVATQVGRRKCVDVDVEDSHGGHRLTDARICLPFSLELQDIDRHVVIGQRVLERVLTAGDLLKLQLPFVMRLFHGQ